MSDSADLPEMRELSDKEQRFVEELTVDWNATAAAKRAGYSPKSARYEARDLKKRPEIQAAIAANRALLKNDARLRRDAILLEVAEMAYARAGGVGAKTVKLRALELLGKAESIFVDRSEVSAALDIHLHASGARERIAARLARMIGA